MKTELIAILSDLDPDTLLSDGGTTWSVDNLIDALTTADEPDTAEYVLGSTSDGRITITQLDDHGYLKSVPSYVSTATSTD